MFYPLRHEQAGMRVLPGHAFSGWPFYISGLCSIIPWQSLQMKGSNL
ncbi:MAG: hypothetical protein ACPGWR_29315 [Ardenticatenaceae bacterium]